MNYTIRDLQSYDEMLGVYKLQQEIWGFDDPKLGLYPPVLKTAAMNGGTVLGAFETETGRMIGFLFGFIGRQEDGRFKLCSQNMGILPEWRKYGIAEALKQAQRQRTRAQGLSLITWTYDPMEGPNAHLNLRKLRAISRTYFADYYGSDFGSLNAGLPTDRLLVEWWIDAPRLEKSPQIELAKAAPIFEIAGWGLERKITASNLTLDSNLLHLESVADVHPLKAANLALALDWRLKIREAFQHYFSRGYIATDFVSITTGGERFNRYILQKATPELFAEIGVEN